VICCRVSPSQKAEVVRLIKRDDVSMVTLAIGDGANDVSMITEAHIGVGLYGNEGMRAVQSSDFALGQFKYLWRLLLVHGRLAYLRNSEMILYFFYKNLVMTLPNFLFAFLNGFSGLTIFGDYYITFYNMFFTAAPLLNKAVFDVDVSHDLESDKNFKIVIPSLYYVGQQRTIFNFKNFWLWELLGCFHTLVIYYVPVYSYMNSGVLLGYSGHNIDIWSLSLCMFTSLVLVVNFKIMVVTRYHTGFNFFAVFIASILLYIMFMWFTNFWEVSKLHLAVLIAHQSPLFYLTIGLCVTICLVVDVAMEAAGVLIWTTPSQFVRTMIAEKKTMQMPKDKAAFAAIIDKTQKRIRRREMKRESQLESKRV